MKKSRFAIPSTSAVSLVLATSLFFAVFASFGAVARPASADDSALDVPPPGVVIDKSPDFKRQFLGSPSFEILPDGTYVATRDGFGPTTTDQTVATTVFESRDKGESWAKIGEVPRLKQAMLFFNNDALWLIGLRSGSIVICRSTDGGKSWTDPKDEKTGVLRPVDSEHSWYCDPAPVLIRDGRVWKEVELYGPIDKEVSPNWATGFQPCAASAPADVDLLDASNWTFSNTVRWPRTPGIGGWLEGNVLFAPDDEPIILMRVDDKKNGGKGAIIRLSADGKTATFDQKNDMIAMPGGAKKFVVRFDSVSGKYWALVNWVHPEDVDQPDKERVRNTLALVCSENLRDWEVRTIVLRHKKSGNVGGIGFQYCDWRVEGDDMVFICRMAWLGAPTCHDANYLTFHRLKNFRELTREDDAETFE